MNEYDASQTPRKDDQTRFPLFYPLGSGWQTQSCITLGAESNRVPEAPGTIGPGEQEKIGSRAGWV